MKVGMIWMYPASKKSLSTWLSMGGFRTGPSNFKSGFIFTYVLSTSYTNLQQFAIKLSFGRNSKTKISTFYYNKLKIFVLEFLQRCQWNKKRWTDFSTLRARPCPTHTACIYCTGRGNWIVILSHFWGWNFRGGTI